MSKSQSSAKAGQLHACDRIVAIELVGDPVVLDQVTVV